MDIAIILLMGLFFCIKSSNAPDTPTTVMEASEPLTSISIETKLNDSFYVDEHAFEVIANGLNFH